MKILDQTKHKCECGKPIYHPSDEDFDDGILICIYCYRRYIDDSTSSGLGACIDFLLGNYDEPETEEEK